MCGDSLDSERDLQNMETYVIDLEVKRGIRKASIEQTRFQIRPMQWKSKRNGNIGIANQIRPQSDLLWLQRSPYLREMCSKTPRWGGAWNWWQKWTYTYCAFSYVLQHGYLVPEFIWLPVFYVPVLPSHQWCCALGPLLGKIRTI